MINIIEKFKRKVGLREKHSYALNKLDLKLRKYIKRRNGFFVEVGANDGVKQSNTLFFEKYYGWKGLLIEAVPELAEQCVVNRPECIVENCALVSDEYKKDFIEIHYCGLMSIIQNDFINVGEHVQVGRKFLKENETDNVIIAPTNTLSNLLEKHRIFEFDLFSLDVEGYELEVLKGLDLSRFRPKYILVEVRDKSVIQNQIDKFYKIRAVLNQTKNYEDILYIRR